MTVPLDRIANEKVVWVPLGEEVAGRPFRALVILTGTAIFNFAGTGSQYERDILEFFVGPTFADGTEIDQLSATGALASIANDGEAVFAGWAVDEVDASLDPTERRIKLVARLAVRDSDGYLQRLSYQAFVVGAFLGLEVAPGRSPSL